MNYLTLSLPLSARYALPLVGVVETSREDMMKIDLGEN